MERLSAWPRRLLAQSPMIIAPRRFAAESLGSGIRPVPLISSENRPSTPPIRGAIRCGRGCQGDPRRRRPRRPTRTGAGNATTETLASGAAHSRLALTAAALNVLAIAAIPPAQEVPSCAPLGGSPRASRSRPSSSRARPSRPAPATTSRSCSSPATSAAIRRVDHDVDGEEATRRRSHRDWPRRRGPPPRARRPKPPRAARSPRRPSAPRGSPADARPAGRHRRRTATPGRRLPGRRAGRNAFAGSQPDRPRSSGATSEQGSGRTRRRSAPPVAAPAPGASRPSVSPRSTSPASRRRCGSTGRSRIRLRRRGGSSRAFAEVCRLESKPHASTGRSSSACSARAASVAPSRYPGDAAQLSTSPGEARRAAQPLVGVRWPSKAARLFADRAVALQHYNRAVGLYALVKGLEWAKPRPREGRS